MPGWSKDRGARPASSRASASGSSRRRTRLDFQANVALTLLDGRDSKMLTVLRSLKERLGNWPAKELEITLDGKDLSGEYIMLEVMNIQHIGPSLHFAPEADRVTALSKSFSSRPQNGKSLATTWPTGWRVTLTRCD